MDDVAEDTAAADAAAIGIGVNILSESLFGSFEAHASQLDDARKRKREALAFRTAVEEDADEAVANQGGQEQDIDALEGLGVKLPSDRWAGDVNMRTLDALLRRVDSRGFERSAQQLEVS